MRTGKRNRKKRRQPGKLGAESHIQPPHVSASTSTFCCFFGIKSPSILFFPDSAAFWNMGFADCLGCRQALAADEEKQMLEYRAQLDADRAQRLSKGTNHADKRLSTKDLGVKKPKSDGKRQKRKDKKDKSKKDKRKKSKRQRASSTSSSSSEDAERATRPAQASGPVRLSEFLRG